MKKLIGLIPTEGKTLEEINNAVDSAWPEISKKLNLEKSSKKKGVFLRIKKLLMKF